MKRRLTDRSHEEWAEFGSIWETDEPPRVTAGTVLLITIIVVVLMAAMSLIWDAISSDVIEAAAPTAAEVMSPGFDLERKIASIEP